MLYRTSDEQESAMAKFLPDPPKWEMEVVRQESEPIEFGVLGETFEGGGDPFDFVIRHYGEPILTVKSAKSVEWSNGGLNDLHECLRALNTVTVPPT